MTSLVSIIIPCFNADQFIDRSIESVFEQDWPNIELIIIDDGSTDNSANHIHKWIDRFSKRGYVLKYFFQENKGPGGAIDTGLKLVSGEYLSLLDADDRLLPDSISERANYLISHPDYSLVRSNGYIVSCNNKWLFTYDAAEKTGNLFDLLMRGKTYNWAGSYMVKTSILFSVLNDRSIYPSRFGQNLQILIPASYKQECGFIDKPLMEYIREGDSLSKATDKTRAKEKGILNAFGYHDIRKHIIDALPLSSDEKTYWLKVAEGIFHRRLLQIAIEHGDTAMAKTNIHVLDVCGELLIEDRIAYASFKKNISSLFWRGINKIKKLSKT